MSTTPIRCPYCGATLRVSVQPCSIVMEHAMLGENGGPHLHVKFDEQHVAHECLPLDDPRRPAHLRPHPPDARSRAHTRANCWCGMPHSPEDFL